jgi:hypothetical protein
MTTAWNNFAGQTAVQELPVPAQAWQAAPQQSSFQQYPATAAQPFIQGGMPPQGPGFGGYQGFQPQAPRPNKMPLIISLIVAGVVLVGGGITTVLLLNKSDKADDIKGSNVLTSQTTDTAGGPNINSQPNTTTSHTSAPSTETSTEHSSTSHTTTSDPTTDSQSTGAGDLDTAQVLAEAWVGYINDADYETAAALVCQAQQQEFVDSFGGQPLQNQIEVVSVEANGDNVTLTIGAVADSSTSTQVTMWPTNTGYFLICDNPLSDADLNWGSD